VGLRYFVIIIEGSTKKCFMNPEVASNVKAILGEGPSWDAKNEILYWIDIRGGAIFSHRLGNPNDQVVAKAERVSSVVPRAKGGLALTLQHGFFTLAPNSPKFEPLSEPIETGMSTSRFNDGKCDPAGRYWAGTMDDSERTASGSLYCIDQDRKLRKLVTQVGVSNGLGWSPDNRKMYYIDSPTKKVSSFDYSLTMGEISNRRTIVDFAANNQPGVPDGMTVDVEGMLWVAHWGGSRVTRWNPDTGKLLDTISVPAGETTSLCFAGKNLDELYITSARDGLDDKALAAQPLAGSLFVVKPGVRGLPTNSFEG
jgi:sugar lactone lactonase YvrE